MTRSQVVRVDSATHVTIQLLDAPHVVYSSAVIRLRHVNVPPPSKTAANIDHLLATSVESQEGLSFIKCSVAIATLLAPRMPALLLAVRRPKAAHICGMSLDKLMKHASAQFKTSLADIKVNPAAAPNTHLWKRFNMAVASTSRTHVAKFVLHGTPEGNVDSVLAEGLRPNPARGNTTRWFTTDVLTSDQYARGAQRRVVFAVLVKKQPRAETSVFTIERCEHHLPLWRAAARSLLLRTLGMTTSR